MSDDRSSVMKHTERLIHGFWIVTMVGFTALIGVLLYEEWQRNPERILFISVFVVSYILGYGYEILQPYLAERFPGGSTD